MLVAHLKSTNKPVNYGDYGPLLSSKSREGTLLSTASGKFGGATKAPGSGETSRSLPPGPPAKGTSEGERVIQGGHELKVFANHNTYSGTWSDGRMHGDGLYVWNDGTEYAGEFRDGFAWGQGEKKWSNGRSYSGEWVRDMMWGNGEMTWPSGDKYAGQFCKGVFHGRGTRSWSNGDRYTGDFVNGEQEGEGSFENAEEGWTYAGHWVHGTMSGDGQMTWPDGVLYVGEWMNGVRNGTGRLTWPDGSSYQGQFINGCVEGHGRKTMPDGSWFEGTFKEGEFEGQGTFHFADSMEFEGLWHKSAVVGPGTHRFPDGTSITGVFESRGARGEGTKTWAQGCTYAGRLLHNHIHHYGVMKWADGRCYVGHFKDEAMHGVGMLNWKDDLGACSYKGYFEENLFQGHGFLEFANNAQYEGEFRFGLYDGRGRFEWPGGSFYHGEWSKGLMHGRGVLCHASAGLNESFIYVGEFVHGEMQGCGCVTLPNEDGSMDEYRGEFESSECRGYGIFTAAGLRLAARFEADGEVGEKALSSGEVYCGQMQRGIENGEGCVQVGDEYVAGSWSNGKRETWLEEAPVDPSSQIRVFSAVRGAGASSASSQPNDGVALAVLPSGDTYVGFLKDGKKHGRGMYVYGDQTAFKGEWVNDFLDGVAHPHQTEIVQEVAVEVQPESATEEGPVLESQPT